MFRTADSIRGRGATESPPNRFASLFYVRDQDWTELDDPAPVTQCLRDNSRSIIARNDSPDVGFDVSVNPYRGCKHGCFCSHYPHDPLTPQIRLPRVGCCHPIGADRSRHSSM